MTENSQTLQGKIHYEETIGTGDYQEGLPPPKQGTPHHHECGDDKGVERKSLSGQQKARRCQPALRLGQMGTLANPVQLSCRALHHHHQRQCKTLWSLELQSFLLPWLKVLSKDRLQAVCPVRSPLGQRSALPVCLSGLASKPSLPGRPVLPLRFYSDPNT